MGESDGRNFDSETRRRIIDAAAGLFMKNGFAATSVRAIGEAAGIGQSSLYHHIASKGGILADIHESFVEDLLAELRAVEQRPDISAAERVREVVRVVLMAVGSRQAQVTVFLREAHAGPPDRKQRIQEKRDEVDLILDRMLRSGIETGEFKSGPEVRLTRLAILGMCNWSYQWYRKGGDHTISDIADHFGDLIVAAIATEHDRKLSGAEGN
jgi:TetR/AcrR family transcriptional regulator, cholesterol catabolism regulator